MATALTSVVSKRLPQQPNILRFVYEIPSVLPSSTSPRYNLEIDNDNGEILQLRINYTGNTTVEVFIFTADLGVRGTIDHLIETPSITDGCFSQGNLGIWFENTDPDPSPLAKGGTGTSRLYLELDNSGATNPTGVVSVELIIRGYGSAGVSC